MEKNPTDLVLSIVAEAAGMLPKEIRLDSRFAEDLGLDSLEFIEMIHMTCKAFKVELDSKELRDVWTPRQLLSALEAYAAT